jgi:alkanesulfonate monooxygenase SsuD/methylene tetrahydromethanopterin reductase-like flavin-dependent oxidoreductase (luciferase family)
MVADTAEQARDLLLPEAWANAHSRDLGFYPPLEPVAAVTGRTLSGKQRERVDSHLAGAIFGTGDQVAQRLAELVERTGADEVMASTSTFDRAELAAVDTAVADLFETR